MGQHPPSGAVVKGNGVESLDLAPSIHFFALPNEVGVRAYYDSANLRSRRDTEYRKTWFEAQAATEVHYLFPDPQDPSRV